MATKRRGHGEGSIYKDTAGRWRAVLDLGWSGGKRQRKYFSAGSRRDVQHQLDQARRQHEQGALALGPQQTLRQFLDAWLEDTARHRLRPTTFARYRSLVRLHVIPSLGRLPLSKVTPQHLSNLYGEKLSAGLSPRSVQFMHAVLHCALRQAMLWGLIVRNPADAVKAPRPKRHQIRALDHEQAQALLRAAGADPLEALYVLALMTGMRQGELLGLRWDDIDWEQGRAQVRHTLQWLAGASWSLDEPKTGHSRRSIRLPATATQTLKAHRRHQNEQRLAVGAAWDDHDLIFCNGLGRPLEKSNLWQRSFTPLLQRAGLWRPGEPRIRFHDLRHTYATLALRDGVPVKVVSETLGHASITLTLDTYSHVLPDMQDDAAARMERLLGSTASG
jgi:integrase